MHRYKELEIWKRSIDLSKKVYQTTSTFPSTEKYGLTSQLNRASVSIASNIAEGAGRNSDKEFNQFLGIAIGSMYEVETQLIIASEIGLINKEELNELCAQIQEMIKMTIGLKSKLV